ncbi:MAG: hypothetical protein ACXVDA_08605 [Ktedonobacterales bacterium]
MAEIVAENLVVFAEDMAGILAGAIAGVGYAARVLIFSGDSVAAALGSMRMRRRAVLPILPLL